MIKGKHNSQGLLEDADIGLFLTVNFTFSF